MTTRRTWFTAALTGLFLSVPTTVWAHGGHAGDDSWLTTNFDHHSLGFFLALLAAIGVASLAGRKQRWGARPGK